MWVVYGQAWSHGSFRVQQLGLLPVIVIEFGTAVYRIANICCTCSFVSHEGYVGGAADVKNLLLLTGSTVDVGQQSMLTLCCQSVNNMAVNLEIINVELINLE